MEVEPIPIPVVPSGPGEMKPEIGANKLLI
jgi:hypothetical protein